MNRRVKSSFLSIAILFSYTSHSRAEPITLAAATAWIYANGAALCAAASAKATALYAAATSTATAVTTYVGSSATAQAALHVAAVATQVHIASITAETIAKIQENSAQAGSTTSTSQPQEFTPTQAQPSQQAQTATQPSLPTSANPLDVHSARPAHLDANSSTQSHSGPIASRDVGCFDPDKGATLDVAQPTPSGPSNQNGTPTPLNPGKKLGPKITTTITTNQGPVINERAAAATKQQLDKAFRDAIGPDGRFNPGAYNDNIARLNNRTVHGQPLPQKTIAQPKPSVGDVVCKNIHREISKAQHRTDIENFIKSGDLQSAGMLRDLAVADNAQDAAKLAVIDSALATAKKDSPTPQSIAPLVVVPVVAPETIKRIEEAKNLIPKIAESIKDGDKLSKISQFMRSWKDIIIAFVKAHPVAAGIGGAATVAGAVWMATSGPATTQIIQQASIPDPTQNKLKGPKKKPESSPEPEKPKQDDPNEKLAATGVGKLTDEAIEEGIKWALNNKNKLDHCFKNVQHKFEPLLEKLGSQEAVIRKTLEAAKDVLPEKGLFLDIPVTVSDSIVHIRGMVVDGIPRLGTMFIK